MKKLAIVLVLGLFLSSVVMAAEPESAPGTGRPEMRGARHEGKMDGKFEGRPMMRRGMHGGRMMMRGRMMPGCPMMGRGMMLARKLEMTPEQRTQVSEIFKAHAEEFKTLMKPVLENRRALVEAVMAETTDENAIRQTSKALGDAIGDAALLGARVRAEVAEVLTPEQRSKIHEFRAMRKERMEEFKMRMEERRQEKTAP